MQFYCEPCIFTNKLKSVLQRPENVLAAQLQRQESMQRHSSPQLHALIQQQRMMQRSHLQQQQQQLRHHMQQHNIPPTSLTKQPAMESGLCAHRLMQYLYHQRHHPLDNNIGENLWQKFFVPNAKKRWCLSLYGNVGHHTLGVFPQAAMDVWQCEICGSKPGRGFETTMEVLPRLCKWWLPKSQQLTQEEESKLNKNSINLEQRGFHMFIIPLRLLGDHVHSTRIAFVIMTSNVGSSVIDKGGRGIGFQLDYDEKHSSYTRIKSLVNEALKQYFRPEFLNRLDEMIVFRQLTKTEVKEIADIMLKEVFERLKTKEIDLQVTDQFTDRVVDEGYSPSYGARPLRRAIMRLLEDSLAKKKCLLVRSKRGIQL